jgi:hypothetical protein
VCGVWYVVGSGWMGRQHWAVSEEEETQSCSRIRSVHVLFSHFLFLSLAEARRRQDGEAVSQLRKHIFRELELELLGCAFICRPGHEIRLDSSLITPTSPAWSELLSAPQTGSRRWYLRVWVHRRLYHVDDPVGDHVDPDSSNRARSLISYPGFEGKVNLVYFTISAPYP